MSPDGLALQAWSIIKLVGKQNEMEEGSRNEKNNIPFGLRKATDLIQRSSPLPFPLMRLCTIALRAAPHHYAPQ